MEASQENRKTTRKTRSWLVFSIGMIVGFILSISIFLADKYFFDSGMNIVRTMEGITTPDESSENTSKKDLKNEEVLPEQGEKSISPVDSLGSDTTATVIDEERANYEEVEFSMDDYNEDMVVLDKILANKKVRVKFQNMTAEPESQKEHPVQFFEIQQWSTPIRNSISYQRNQNILKIKGMDISNVEIYNIEGQYYLYNNNRYYLISNNNNFEKLNDTDLPIQK
jgi:hypothetical protein